MVQALIQKSKTISASFSYEGKGANEGSNPSLGAISIVRV
jgi:hypothetical protein